MSSNKDPVQPKRGWRGWGRCWEAQCKIALKEKVLGGNGEGPEVPRHCVLIAEKHFLPLAMLGGQNLAIKH